MPIDEPVIYKLPLWGKFRERLVNLQLKVVCQPTFLYQLLNSHMMYRVCPFAFRYTKKNIYVALVCRIGATCA